MAVLFKIIIFSILGLALVVPPLQAETAQVTEEPSDPRSISIRGLGFIGNRLMLNHVRTLIQDEDDEPAHFTPTDVEDALFIINARMQKLSYLEATYELEMTFTDGRVEEREWHPGAQIPMQQGARVADLRVRVERGPLFQYRELTFDGLTEREAKEALNFFYSQALLGERRNYTEGGLRQGVNSIAEDLRSKGYADATAVVVSREIDRETGLVDAHINVVKGPIFYVRETKGIIDSEDLPEELKAKVLAMTNREPRNQVYSLSWLQDWRQKTLTILFEEGYPRARANHEITRHPEGDDTVFIDVELEVEPRRRYAVGEINFEGTEKTKESVLRRRIRLREGDWLNRMEAENARFRFVRLGVFDDVTLRFSLDEDDREIVNINYEFEESGTLDMSLLFGYGSYEQLRGGIEVRHGNIFGRAHHSQLRFIQSFKSTSAQYDYNVPELFGAPIDGNARLSYLRREEVSFDREEWGLTTGLSTYWRRPDLDLGITYRIGQVNTTDVQSTLGAGAETARIGSVGFSVARDRRDNPIYPNRGYRFRVRPEVATAFVGSEVNYYRLLADGSYHLPLGNNFAFHTGISGGLANSLSSDRDELPLSERFFLGGENTIRGFTEGEASPVDSNNNYIGSELYALFNLEFETKLSRSISIITFSDTVWQAANLHDPGDSDVLTSLGLGVRFKTPLGPLRIEYGHNLNPRPVDPSGTIHFSLGFPF